MDILAELENKTETYSMPLLRLAFNFLLMHRTTTSKDFVERDIDICVRE
jgi:hypothetical protein